MKEKPIIFNTEMVKAILEGRKTQTRRIVKPQPPHHTWNRQKGGYKGCEVEVSENYYMNPPYRINDILWVRETWCRDDMTLDDLYYKANYDDRELQELFAGLDLKWKPSIHMPRAAARIFLKVTNVRVERLQDITSTQIEAEGTELELLNTGEECRYAFQMLWNSTLRNENQWKQYGWEVNPWVWVIEFERCGEQEGKHGN